MSRFTAKKLTWMTALSLLFLVGCGATAAQWSIVSDTSYMQTLNALGSPHAVLKNQIAFAVIIVVTAAILYFLIRVMRWHSGETNE